MNEIKKLENIINNSKYIVFFGGAGVSTESGIPDFRGERGLFKETPERIVSHTYWFYHPEEFYQFYFQKMVYKDAKPNECHKFLAKLEKNKKVTIITQNIDGLHQIAGSTDCIELHGSIHRNHCIKCGKAYKLEELNTDGIPRCTCGAVIKPDVVLYEEPLDKENISRAVEAISACDTLIVAGTSLAVYPAASFIDYFSGENLVVINNTETSADAKANLVIRKDINEVFKGLKL